MTLFGCGEDPIVLDEYEPSFHDASVRDPSTKGRGDYSNHPDVNIIADVDSYIEFAHLSPATVTQWQRIDQHQQQTQLGTKTPSLPQQQPNLSEGSASSDSTTSRMVIDDSTHFGSGQNEARQRYSLDRGMDATTHAGSQVPAHLQKRSNTDADAFTRHSIDKGVMQANGLNRRSIEMSQPYGAKQSTVHNVPPLGSRNSIGDKLATALGRNSLDHRTGSRTGSGELDRVSATHYGGQTPTLVPVRSSSLGPPEQMIVDPTTHAEARFRKRQSSSDDRL